MCFFFAFLVLVETTSIWHVLCLRSLCNKVCAHRMNKRAKKRNYIAFVTLMMKYCEAVVWSISPKIKKNREENRQRRPRQRRRTTGTAKKQMIKELNMPQFEVWCRLLVECICLVCSCTRRARYLNPVHTVLHEVSLFDVRKNETSGREWEK